MIRSAHIWAALGCLSGWAFPAWGEERWDHRGSLGLMVGGGADARAIAGGPDSERGWFAPLELGVSAGLLDSGDFYLSARVVPWGAPFRAGALISYRGYFGQEAWKTFFDLGILSDIVPLFSVGPRLGFGVQYELSPVVGVYLGAAGYVGGGHGVRFGGELTGGFQFRTYLLE